MEKGYLAIVLHAHLPYVRPPEYEASLEENWLYEAISEAYLPLLFMLEGLVEEDVDFRLTLSITPTLASMLLDPFLQFRYLNRLEKLIELAENEIRRTQSELLFHALAHGYHRRFVSLYEAFLHRYNRNLVQAFIRLQELGKIEIMASAATHGYLPLLSTNPSSVRAQIAVGILHHEQIFGRRPQGFWLPECGFYPGLDEILREYGIRYIILETHGITRAAARPKYGVYAPVYCPSGVAAFGRDPESSRQVWSSIEGYPGDYDYREFYRDIAHDLDFGYIKPYIHPLGIRTDTGFKYFRITGKENDKEVYLPERADRKARAHAEDFLSLKKDQVDHLASVMGRKPILVAPYDAELFGLWWFEGPRWLDYLIRKTRRTLKSLRLVTLSEYLEEYPVNEISMPCMSSWGRKGFHETWLNERNDWIYRHLHAGALSMERLARDYSDANGLTLKAVRQAARELLLAQASDWAFMMDRDTMAEYATRRTHSHLSRLSRLKDQLGNRSIDEAWLTEIENQDNIFPEIDYRLFL